MADPSEIYHIYDYALFYRNLEQNAKDRVNAFHSINYSGMHPRGR